MYNMYMYMIRVMVYVFNQPSLGHDVRNRHKLLHYLQERERDGLGGLGLTDIMDSLPNHQKALKVINSY